MKSYFDLNIFSLITLVYVVSNEVPEHPVVSPVSGSVFERRLIEKYIADNGVDPTNGKEITVDQLIEIKSIQFLKISLPVVIKLHFSPTNCEAQSTICYKHSCCA